MADPKIFEETFVIVGHNLDTSKTTTKVYDRVTRWAARSIPEATGSGDDTAGSITISFDVWKEGFPCAVGDQITVAVATTLNLDGTKMDKGFRPFDENEVNLASPYHYVVTGTVYRFEESKGDNLECLLSAGGLLIQIIGPYKKLTPLRVQEVYVLFKKDSGVIPQL
ncbi:nucleic acid-binding protein [Pseudovirgaria hyperparasitica]|uniref:Nucleic acid-binding protein n=1 Tax=Pseudovirgaria hyperparasitica TaxID=470096 RepID=A0A6A6VXH9_9PEZI|nr:nucleic acid-binding protein [Pseudovirgaria hyperparasitica]KAF2755378.1 nucleic acid-binding protein [Pseudovirgaria hyperparasitica]